MAENTSRPCSSVPSRNGLWPSDVHSGAIREFISCSCAGSNGFCTASSGARMASRKNSSVTAAATMVILERRKEEKMSLPTIRPTTRPDAEAAMASASLACGMMESVMPLRRTLDGGPQSRVDHRVEDIDDEVDGDEDQRHGEQIGGHDRNIHVLHRLHEQQSHARPL